MDEPHSTAAPLLVFRYRALERASGRRRSGEASGDSAYAVRASLRRLGLEVEEIESVSGGEPPSWLGPLTRAWVAHQRRRHRTQKADLCDALATLLQAGVPLEQAVVALGSSSARPADERAMLRTLRDRLREGLSFGAACAQCPTWFDRLDLALIEAGAHAGDLAQTLLGLGKHHQRIGAIGQKILIALAYPVLLLLAGIAAVEFMSFNTLPQLVAMITQAHHQPPALTLLVMGAGRGLAHWWPLLIAGGIGLGMALRSVVAHIPLQSALGLWLHGNPVARARARMRVAQLATSLARLRRAGMPLAEALQVVGETLEERALRELLLSTVDAIRRGEDLSAVIQRSPLLDPEFAQLLQLGERSGELTDMLERIAERYQRAADRSSERLAAFLSPIAIIIMAALIAVVVLASAQPLLQLGDLV